MKTLDLDEAAQFLRLHPHTLEAKARAGEIPGAKPGKRWVFLDVDLADWLRGKYHADKEEICRSTSVAPSTGVNGKSMVGKLGKLLEQKTKSKPKNSTTAAVLNFGAPRS